jgi:hypothetical protein
MPSIIYNGARISSKSMIRIAARIADIDGKNGVKPYIKDVYKMLVGRYPSERQLNSI